ncbi:expressed unknown protein [Seminavis robusta]|uniref:F-box domain-containing protein n=1 Tax=Seminavis robusta TaxID=568900 RepID=A0A9N8ENF6_9STRA|nr:expressed unknown protein [Seminavis robusta]|eukprot:Sro1388_g268440.1 n/a (490) ;mRNA; f:14658-16127
MFPADVLPVILQFLDPETQYLVARCVSRGWYHAVVDSAPTTNSHPVLYMTLRHRRGDASFHLDMKGRTSCTRRIRRGGNNNHDEEEEEESKQPAKRQRRTRGHLPEPRMDICTTGTSSTVARDGGDKILRFQAKEMATTFAQSSQKYSRNSAVLGQLSSIMMDGGCNQAVDEEELLTLDFPSLKGPAIHPSTTTSVGMKNKLKRINLSLLKGLKQVSVRGCSNLTDLAVSPNLIALDAHGCSQLKRLLIPNIILHQSPGRDRDTDNQDGSLIRSHDDDSKCSAVAVCHLQFLNLNGCRSLDTIGGPTWKTRDGQLLATPLAYNLRQVDLSSCTKLSTEFVGNLLQATRCLESIALRYVATNVMLQGLANSQSASLRLVDVAFSHGVSDDGINPLVANAVHLERLNLRGCRNVSSQCYNDTPIRLQQRRRQDGSTTSSKSGFAEGLSTTNTATSGSRKGDNLFALMPSYEHAKTRPTSSITKEKQKDGGS